MSQNFIKNQEDFVCEQCGFKVGGNGYTNHCPECLWSKHLDINPGDRAATCGELMKPLDVIMDKGQFEIVHQCVNCGYKKRNKTAPNDQIEKFLANMV